MSQQGPWGPQGGQGDQGGYDPQAGYPQQGGGYPPQPGGQPGGSYPPQGYPQADYPQQGGHPTQGGYAPQGGYPHQPGGYAQPGGYPQQGGYGQPGYGQPGLGQPYGGQGSPPGSGVGAGGAAKKSPLLIIGIVVAALVLLAAVGGIFMALSGSKTTPTSTITPGDPAGPSSDPAGPSSDPAGPSSDPAGPSSDPAGPSSDPGSGSGGGDTVQIGSGIVMTVAAGWQITAQQETVVSVTNRQAVLVGRTLQVKTGTNAVQLCDAIAKAVLKDAADARFGEPEEYDVGSERLAAARCGSVYTQASQDGKSVEVAVSTLVSVRKDDGVTIVGTMLYTKGTDAETKTQVGQMVSSMLSSQNAG